MPPHQMLLRRGNTLDVLGLTLDVRLPRFSAPNPELTCACPCLPKMPACSVPRRRQDRVVVDKKAESESAATLTAHTKEITNEQVSASMQEAVNDLRCIIEARQRIRMLQAEIRRTCIPVVLLHLTFAAAPSMWNMTGFLITLNTFTMPHALAHIATNYDCAPKQH